MKVSDALAGVRSVFLDTAPLIYHVERHPVYADAFQVACALRSGVDAFVTNDRKLLRAPRLRVLVLDDLDPG